MNERTIQLYKQASKWVCENEPGVVEETHLFYELMPAKFAELIVKECIDTVLDSSVEYATRPQIAEELKEHFGVEE